MFVSWKVIFGKPLSKLSCVCLPLEKVVNGKHFPVKEKHFPVNGKHFPVKEKFDLVFRKMFFLLTVFVFRKVISGKTLSKLSCVCLPLEKLVNGKHFPVKGKMTWFSGKCFPGKFGRKTLSGSFEKFRNVIICWLYQIWSSNFWLLYIFCFEYLFFNFIS